MGSVKMSIATIARVFRLGTQVLGGVLLIGGLSSVAQARVVPEIDPGTAQSAVTLLIGSMLVIAGKFRK